MKIVKDQPHLIKVLYAEDDKIDQMAFEKSVKEYDLPYDYKIISSIAETKKVLNTQEFDILITDYFLGDGTAFDVLDLKIDIPIIVVTGTGDEEIAVKAMKRGASDYIIKDNDRYYLKVLPHTVENAINYKKAAEELRRNMEFVRLLQIVAVAANEARAVEDVLKICLKEVCVHMKWPLGHVFYASKEIPGYLDSSKLWYMSDERFNPLKEFTEKQHFMVDLGFQELRTDPSKPLWISNISTLESFPRLPFAKEFGIHSALAFPIMIHTEVAAVLEFFSTKIAYPDELLLEVLTQVATQIARVIERKRAEETLQQSQEYSRLIIETANDAFVSIDSDGFITEWNHRAEIMFGWKREQILGRTLKNTIIPPPHRSVHERSMKNILESSEESASPKRIEFPALHRDGHEFIVEMTLWSTSVGEKLQFNAFIRDITERKKIDQMKSDFVSFVSHQLKTPIVEIRGYLDNLLAGFQGPLSDKQKEVMSQMLAVCSKSDRLISDLLNLSKIERGMVAINIQATDLTDIINFAIRSYVERIKKKGLEFKLELTPKNILILADRDKLIEVIQNLLDNALKFTDKGSITLRSSEKNGLGVVEIIDTGSGMSESVLDKFLNQEFVLSGNPRPKGGSGLGLHIAKSFMKIQGGTLTATSSPGQGTHFTITISKKQPS